MCSNRYENTKKLQKSFLKNGKSLPFAFDIFVACWDINKASKDGQTKTISGFVRSSLNDMALLHESW
jgi:hypothetical protein